MASRSVLFAEPVRTAIGTFGGNLKDVPAPALGAVAIGAAVKRAGINPDEVETVVMGNVVQAGTKMNPARQAAVHAGLPVTVPALTLNRIHVRSRRKLTLLACVGQPLPSGIALPRRLIAQ
jgi:acetyl-CoA C-acetyltransferase